MGREELIISLYCTYRVERGPVMLNDHQISPILHTLGSGSGKQLVQPGGGEAGNDITATRNREPVVMRSISAMRKHRVIDREYSGQCSSARGRIALLSTTRLIASLVCKKMRLRLEDLISLSVQCHGGRIAYSTTKLSA